MELIIQATVATDDGRIKKTVTGKVALATEVYGSDKGIAKQDFLQQAEALFRMIGENQVPALYDFVLEKATATPPEDPAKAKLREKLKSIRDRRAKRNDKPDAKPDEQQPPEEAQPETPSEQPEQAQEEAQPETQEEAQ